MEYKYLGDSGLEVSRLSYGTWVSFGQQMKTAEECAACLSLAKEKGINFFDTAEIYTHGEAEILLGKCFKKLGWNRSDYVVATKIFWGGQGPNRKGISRKRIVEGAQASLTRLGLEYVDVLFCHRPDWETPVEETVRAMNHIINQGKALYWGTSEWPAERIRQAIMIAEQLHLIAPIAEQPKYNLFNRDRVEVEYSTLFKNYRYGTTTWSPLEYGILTGKYNHQIPSGSRLSMSEYDWLKARLECEEGQRKVTIVHKLKPLADQLGTSTGRLAIAWCLLNSNVTTAILGASTPDQLIENIDSLDVLPKLTPAIQEQIESILSNKPNPIEDFKIRN